MRFTLLALLLLTVPALAQEPEVGLVNGALEGDEDGNGVADGWSFVAGGPADKLDVALSLDEGRDGGSSQKIDCTRFDDGHVMLAQIGEVAVERGKWYRLDLWTRGENLGNVKVSLRDTNGWIDCLATRSFIPRERWRPYSFTFQSAHTVSETSRLQVWFTSTGTLWLDDISLVEIPARANASIIEDIGSKNLIPNSSFECGPSGWMSYGYWKLFGETITADAPDGNHAMHLKWSRADAPVMSFDYYEMGREPYVKPDIVTDGWLRVRAGEQYVLSAYMRADREVSVAMRAYSATKGSRGAKVEVGAEWVRYEYAFTPQDDLCFPNIEVDCDAQELDDVELLIDAVQLERGDTATDYEPRRPIEIGVVAGNGTGIFRGDEQSAVRWSIYNSTDAEAAVGVSLVVTDIFDREVLLADGVETISPGESVSTDGPLADLPYGFYRATVASPEAGSRQVRLARIPKPEQAETPFGINHAYPWRPMLKLAREIGISEVRDWSLKWTHVEPEKGRFEFDMTDYQIDRPLKLGMDVLCMFPFPSAEWSSTAPPLAEVPDALAKRAPNRIRTAYAPRDPAELENYVFECVKHYKDRIKVWEVFNESIFTTYSLPNKAGYTALDYLPLLQAVYRGCKRADPDCQVMGGYSTPPASFDKLHKPFIEAGGLKYCDLYSLHIYPRGEPEFIGEQLDRITALMDQHGGRIPMWMTEYAYYADDDPTPATHRWPPLVESELVQAQWNTRMCVTQLAHGVAKIFYHIWKATPNRDGGTRIFFEVGGAPRKIAATQAAMAWLLGPAPEFLREANTGEDTSCYIFRNEAGIGGGPITVAVAWRHFDESPISIPAGCAVYNMAGAPVAAGDVKLDTSPIYIVTENMSAADLAAALER